MNSYLVKINFVIDFYEKEKWYLLLAWNDTQAQATAVYTECHNTDNIEWKGINEASDGGEFIYKTFGALRLPESEAAIITKYLPTIKYDLEKLTDSGIFQQLGIKEWWVNV